MPVNVGSADKVIRIVMGIVLLSLIYFLSGNIRWVGLIGIVPIMTARVGWCPLYSLLGIRTCPMKK